MVGSPTGCSASFFYAVKIKFSKLTIVVEKGDKSGYNCNRRII